MILGVELDDMRAHDEPWVYSSWLSSYRHSPTVRGIPNDRYYRKTHDRCELLLERSKVYVARPRGWPEGITGWLCVEYAPEVVAVHFAHVKREYQRMGVCSALLAVAIDGHDERKVFTHALPPGDEYFRKRGYAFAPHYAGKKRL